MATCISRSGCVESGSSHVKIGELKCKSGKLVVSFSVLQKESGPEVN